MDKGRSAKSLRIIFMGTPGFAVASLDQLVKNGYSIIAVVTGPDRPAGRGQQLQMSEVKQYALQHKLPVLQPEKLKDPGFIEQLRNLKADLQIVVAFRMLPEVVWNMPPLGTFNLHASLLPRYRGAAPINRAVMNGDTETGVTTFFLQHEIDTGHIAFQQKTEIGLTETAGEVHDRLMIIGAALVLKTVDAVAAGNCPHIPQAELVAPGEHLPDAPKLFREDGQIRWLAPGTSIVNHIRGLSPYPGAWTMLHENGKEPVMMKIFSATFSNETHNQEIGTLVDENGQFKVAVAQGWVHLNNLQLAGKKRMSAREFLRGYHMHFPARLI